MKDFVTEIEIPITQKHVPGLNVHVMAIQHIEGNTSTLQELKKLRQKMLPLEEKLLESKHIIPLYQIYDSSFFLSKNAELTALAPLRNEERQLLNDLLPRYFSGTKTVQVTTDFVELESEIVFAKKSARPATSQKITLTLKDREGNLVNGETTLSVIDAALLDMRNHTGDIVGKFYTNKNAL